MSHMYDKLKGFVRMARQEDVGVAYPGKKQVKSKYPINEVIGPGGKKVGELSEREEKVPYYIIQERVVNDY